MAQKLTNINKYTLINEDKTNIYFFPQFALYKEQVKTIGKNLHILFELKKEKEEKLYSTYINIVNSNFEKTYTSYLVYFVELSEYRYAIINSKNNIEKNKNRYKDIIDFNSITFDNFLTLFGNNKKISKLIPELTDELKKSINTLKDQKTTVNISKRTEIFNFYQNVSGYLINELELFLSVPEEQEISINILKNVKNNYQVIFNNSSHIKLAYLTLYAFIINKVKSSMIKADPVLKKDHLVVRLNNQQITQEEFVSILPNILNLKEKKVSNKLSDCLKSIIDSKSTKDITNQLNIIVAGEKYQNTTNNSETIRVNESSVKDLILNSFINLWYYPLPNSQVLIYNFDKDNIDFICVSSLDVIHKIFLSFKRNINNPTTKEPLHLLKYLDNIITDKVEKKTRSFIKIYILTLIVINLYNYRRLNDNALLFDHGDYILNLSFDKGKYNIEAINSATSRRIGRLIKLKETTKETISSALKISETEFNKQVNSIIYDNLENALLELNIQIDITEVSHKGIKFILKRPQKDDIFECSLNAEELLMILSSIQISKTEKLNKIETKEEKEISKIPCLISEKDEAYIRRKCHTIVEIMKKQNLDNEKYRQIVKLYQELNKAREKRKNQILLELKDLI